MIIYFTFNAPSMTFPSCVFPHFLITLRPRQNYHRHCRRHSQIHFLVLKVMNSKAISNHVYPGKLGFCFHHYFVVYDVCKHSGTLRSDGRFCLFAHYTISLLSLCRLTCKHWTYKMPVRYILSSLCLRLSQFSQLPPLSYMKFSTYLFWWFWEYVYLSFNHH